MLAYCLPEQKESVAQKFNLSYKEDILRILGNEAMTIKELTSRLRRPRPTVGRWVQQMEAEGTLRSETRVIPGVSGIHKFCWVKDG
jgi:transposase